MSRSEPSPVPPPAPPASASAPGSTRLNYLAVAALVLGVVGFVGYPVIPSILAIVLGLRARRQVESGHGGRGRALAEAAIVLGWAALALLLLSGGGLVAALFLARVG